MKIILFMYTFVLLFYFQTTTNASKMVANQLTGT